MTNQQILTKAIQKAIDGGWDIDLETVLQEMQKKWSLYGLQYTGYSGLLFSKDFAKALWGDEFKYFLARNGRGSSVGQIEYIAWQYHLQQMVVAEDPIKYIGENI